MNTGFQEILNRMVTEQGIGIFDNTAQCEVLLSNYAKDEFRREIRLFLLSIKAGCHRELLRSDQPDRVKQNLVQKLQNDFGIPPTSAEETVTLVWIIIQDWKKNDQEKTVQLEQAARKGDYRSQYELALLSESRKQYAAAIRWFKEAAKQGLALYEQSLILPQKTPPKKQGVEKNISPLDNFVHVAGGTFLMGSPLSDLDRESNEAPHHVKVSNFYLGKHQVTQREYEEIMGINPSEFKGDNLPVEYISWYDAVLYCNKRSEQEGLLPVYTINKTKSDPNNSNEFDSNRWLISWNQNTNGYRLPTEAEWEYACRSGTTTPFYTGPNITTNQANYNYGGYNSNNPRGKTSEVGSFAPNPWGLYDMHGNVWEWCWDWYGNYSVGLNQHDPLGAPLGTQRVLRGGSWNKKPQHIRSAYRIGSTPSLRSGDFGFRIAHS